MNNIYYTVEKELKSLDPNIGIEETTGHKRIIAYFIEDEKLKKFFDLDLANHQNSEYEMQEYLNDNGYFDKEYLFKKL